MGIVCSMFHNMWALVIEDDAHSLIAICNILRELGICFKRNTTGANVLDQLRSMQPQPDFILLDLSLPLADPFALIEYIRRDPMLYNIPIICLTDTSNTTLIEQARQSGSDALLAKPLPRRQFADMLRRILSGEQLWAIAV